MAALIGITTRIDADRSGDKIVIRATYVRAIEQAGGTPVLLPSSMEPRSRDALWERIDGLFLSGGGDIDPARFGEERHAKTGHVSELRDAFEIELIGRAIRGGRPLLAVCRGIQILNVALGGSIYQDMSLVPGSRIEHSQTEPRDQTSHLVRIADRNTRMSALLGGIEELPVNSMHHQAINRLGKGLRIVARAEDGVVEGVELEDGSAFLLGVQWHPEELIGRDPAARKLFSAFVAASSAG